jgi:HSP20 family molecular chaperone IbpA
MNDDFYQDKYLLQITRKCREMTVSQMLRNADAVIQNNRMGFGHYLFDGAHAPKDKWTIPGALDVDVVRSDEGVEVMVSAGPFQKEELSVYLNDGILGVEALHEEEGPEGGTRRRIRMSKHINVPFDFDLEDVEVGFEEEVLTVKIPKPVRSRRMLEMY